MGRLIEEYYTHAYIYIHDKYNIISIDIYRTEGCEDCSDGKPNKHDLYNYASANVFAGEITVSFLG